jgi:hypothetical protein
MADSTVQSYKNHTRLDPGFHFVLSGSLLVALILSILALVRHPGLETVILLLLTLALLWNSAITRTYSLKVQDRVIRLEERLRLSLLLPDALKPRINELTKSQLVALRFASDAELPGLALRAMDEHLTSKQIKTSIQAWRPDTHRV